MLVCVCLCHDRQRLPRLPRVGPDLIITAAPSPSHHPWAWWGQSSAGQAGPGPQAVHLCRGLLHSPARPWVTDTESLLLSTTDLSLHDSPHLHSHTSLGAGQLLARALPLLMPPPASHTTAVALQL